MKISRKVREEAALICAIAASSPQAISVRDVSAQLCGDEVTDASWTAVRAWGKANAGHIIAGLDTTTLDGLHDVYAEAEALLRCGWSPGEAP